MDILVRDTKHPKRHPFLISQEGFDRLREKFGDQYVQATEVRIDGFDRLREKFGDQYVQATEVRIDKEIGVVKVPKVEVNEKKSAVRAAK